MEKIIEIDGKGVGFKTSASFLIKYRNYFGADGLKDLGRLSAMGEAGDLNAMIIMQQIAWALAKNYDKKIPQLETWLDSFEDFDFAKVFKELQPLISKSFGTTAEAEEAESTEDGEEKNVEETVA